MVHVACASSMQRKQTCESGNHTSPDSNLRVPTTSPVDIKFSSTIVRQPMQHGTPQRTRNP